MRNKLKVSIAVGALMAACLVLSACPNNDSIKNASDAVNKYGNTLSAFQDAEIKLHDRKAVSDATHRSILNAEVVAAKAGHDLDAGIAVAAKGGDPAQFIDVANRSFDDMVTVVNRDPVSQGELVLSVQVASDALKNAISLINALRAKSSAGIVAPSTPQHGQLSWLWALCLFPMLAAAGGVGLTQTIQLLQIALELEPVAFDLITKFATSLKGKSTEEILAMNESLFNKVEQTAQDELNKLPPTA